MEIPERYVLRKVIPIGEQYLHRLLAELRGQAPEPAGVADLFRDDPRDPEPTESYQP